MYTDIELIEGLKSRDETIIKFFYTNNKVKAFSLLLKYGVRENECLSIYNDSVISLIENLKRGKFKEQSKLSTYLLSIAKFKCFKEFKRQKKTNLVLNEEIKNIDIQDDPYDFEDLDSSRIEKATNALQKIDETCRNILVSFYYEGVKLAKLAKDLGYSQDFIRVKKGRCLKKLKNLIAI